MPAGLGMSGDGACVPGCDVRVSGCGVRVPGYGVWARLCLLGPAMVSVESCFGVFWARLWYLLSPAVLSVCPAMMFQGPAMMFASPAIVLCFVLYSMLNSVKPQLCNQCCT